MDSPVSVGLRSAWFVRRPRWPRGMTVVSTVLGVVCLFGSIFLMVATRNISWSMVLVVPVVVSGFLFGLLPGACAGFVLLVVAGLVEQALGKGLLISVWEYLVSGLVVSLVGGSIGQVSALYFERGRLLGELHTMLHRARQDEEMIRRTEEALRSERNLLRSLIDILPLSMYTKDTAGRKTMANPVDVRIIGGSSEADVLGKTDYELFPKEVADRFFADDRSVLDIGTPILDREEYYFSAEGKKRWLLTSKVPLRNAEGEIQGLVGVGRDITERKLADEVLKRLTRELRAVSSCNQALMRAADEQTLLNDICRIMCDQAGYRMAWVGYAENDEARTVRSVAWAGTDGGYVATANITWADTERGQGPGGMAIRSGKTAYVQDSASDPRIALWRESALQGGYRSIVALPLKDENASTFGVLCIYSSELNAFTPDETRLLEELAGDLAFGITTLRTHTDNKKARQEIDLRLAELEAINRASSAMRSAHTLEEMLPALFSETLQIMKVTGGAIWLYDHSHDEIFPVVSRGYGEEQGYPSLREKPGQGIVGRVFASGKPEVTDDLYADSRLPETVRERILPGSTSAAVPIRTENAIIGAFTVVATAPRIFTNDDVNLLSTLCEIAGSAIQRASLHDQTDRRYRHLVALSEIDKAITSTFDLSLCLSTVLRCVRQQLEVDAADILVFNPGSQKLEFFAGNGFRTDAVERTRLGMGENHAGVAALERRPVIIDDLRQIAQPSVQQVIFLADEFVCYRAVPLVAKGLVRGVLEVFHRRLFNPDDEWTGYLDALAGRAAVAIEDITLFDSLQHSNLEISIAYDATIEGWSRALDLRDKETEGHTQRVTEMTVRLCRHFGMSEAELVHARRGALLHDIGKMGVPDNILRKAGPLTDGEWVIMKKHPTLAFELLRPIHYLRPALDIPYRHHEKWDGSGYPLGLKGESIPLVARIFAVVDVFDALTSDRPYRDAWTKEKALEHIRSLAGSHFDPGVVKGCLESGVLS